MQLSALFLAEKESESPFCPPLLLSCLPRTLTTGQCFGESGKRKKETSAVVVVVERGGGFIFILLLDLLMVIVCLSVCLTVSSVTGENLSFPCCLVDSLALFSTCVTVCPEHLFRNFGSMMMSGRARRFFHDFFCCNLAAQWLSIILQDVSAICLQ